MIIPYCLQIGSLVRNYDCMYRLKSVRIHSYRRRSFLRRNNRITQINKKEEIAKESNN